MASEDPYEILGVPASASMKEIKKAFKYPPLRAKALQCHPDKQQATDSGESFRRLRAAYEILCNDDLRLQFSQDRAVRQERESQYKEDSEVRKRFRDDLLAREAQYRAQKSAKTSGSLHRKSQKPPPSPSPERKQSKSCSDFGNVIHIRWTTRTTLYTECILKVLFAPCGAVIEVVTDRENRGAYVVFASGDAAAKASRMGLSEFAFETATRREAEAAKKTEEGSAETSPGVKSHLQRLRERLKRGEQENTD